MAAGAGEVDGAVVGGGVERVASEAEAVSGLTPGTLTVTPPLTVELMFPASLSRFSTWNSLCRVAVLTMSMLRSVPSDGSNWATCAVFVQPVLPLAKVAAAPSVVGAVLMVLSVVNW